jgi:2-hydroxyacyl-CoA lyase 1
MAELDGATLIARSLKQQGVDHMFGIVGFPVIPIALAAQREGIHYIGFRNEQSASYAAGAVGYLTGRPAACLCVSGPGMIHGIAGAANAWANAWPMILLGGANDAFQNGQGAFQEAPQLEAARPFVKYAARPDRIERLPFYVEQAVRTSIYGRPGASYLDLPNDIIVGQVEESEVAWKPRCADPPCPQAHAASIERALDVLRNAERPLVVVGKGAAYARAEGEVREFIEKTRLPFLPSPMGKGVVPDDHRLSVASARSDALKGADAILLLGARLNWILHFGQPPRFREDVKIIQLDICAEEIGTNVPPEVALVGDAKAIVSQLNAALDDRPWSHPAESAWRKELADAGAANRAAVEAMETDCSVPMGYYRTLAEIRDQAPRDAILVCEGSNTMDISRTVLPNFDARERLDAGTFGTMGVGLGFAIAAAAVHPERKVICVEGDSAFGFSGMEVETACRFAMNITFVIVNNNGIGMGFSELDPSRPIPPMAYTPKARYEKIADGFGGKGFFVETPDEYAAALKEALSIPTPTIVNVAIDPRAQRKPQRFEWLTR